jgi:hypothetical protein
VSETGEEEAQEPTEASDLLGSFNEREMDKIIRQIVDKVRGNYFQNGESGRGIPAEVKRIIEANIDRV